MCEYVRVYLHVCVTTCSRMFVCIHICTCVAHKLALSSMLYTGIECCRYVHTHATVYMLSAYMRQRTKQLSLGCVLYCASRACHLTHFMTASSALTIAAGIHLRAPSGLCSICYACVIMWCKAMFRVQVSITYILMYLCTYVTWNSWSTISLRITWLKAARSSGQEQNASHRWWDDSVCVYDTYT